MPRPLALAVATRHAILGAAAISAVAGAAAQQADSSAPLETVIVTGTRARDRTELNAASPVDILRAEDLRAAAGPEANLGQALQSLLPSFNYLDQSNSGSADHVRAAQLRGLNPDQVLVLVNGKRVHPTAIVNVESTVGLGSVAVDFASIPVNAVRRIEVLRDGAGAQYGSDAIAGVINIILDDAREGGEVSVSGGEYLSHFAPTNQNLRDGATADLQGSYGWALGADGFLRLGLDASHHNATNRAGFDQFYPNAAFNTVNPASNIVTFRVGDAQVKNLNLWGNSGFGLPWGLSGYATLLYNHRTSQGDAYFREPNDTSNNVAAVYPNGFLPHSTGTNDDVHAVAGVRGPLAPRWTYDASVSYGGNDFRYGLENSINASYGTASPTSFHLGSFHSAQEIASFDASGDISPDIHVADATFAWGAEVRRESYATGAGDPASYLLGTQNPAATPGAQGDGGLEPSNTSDSHRFLSGVYADVSGKPYSSVFLEGAIRWDHVSGDASSSASTGKVSARWEPIPGYAVRAAGSKNFRAPALAQVAAAYSPTTYVAGGVLGGVQIVPDSSPAAIALGAQPLRPETSRNYSLGLTAQPLEGLQLSLDWFDIAIDDRIALSQPVQDPVSLQTYQFFTNAVDTVTRGFDFVAAWTAKLGGGDLRLSDASTFATNSIRNIHQQSALAPSQLFGLQAQNAITTAVPRRRDVLTARWTSPSWDLLVRGTHTGEVTRVFDFGGGFTPTSTYRGTGQLDLDFEFKPLRDLGIALGAQNLTNQYPTLSSPDINYGGSLAYDYLSPIGFNGRYLYARLRYVFH